MPQMKSLSAHMIRALVANDAKKPNGASIDRDERKSSKETERVGINSEGNERSENLLNRCDLCIDEKGNESGKLKIGLKRESARVRENC